MREIVREILDYVGLLRLAKRAKRALSLARLQQRAERAMHTRGWLKWEPLIPMKEFSTSCVLAIRTLRANGHELGDYLEFGVSRGSSMACMGHALRTAGLSNVRLVGFDSFEGLPSEAAEQFWAPGEYASTIGATKRYLKAQAVNLDEVHLVKGWFKDTLTPETVERLSLRKASLIMIDCDIYTASKEALWFCGPLIVDRAVIIFDDWGWRADRDEIGQREAYAEFLDAFPHLTSESLPAYIPQARMFLVTQSASAPNTGTAVAQ
jgi:hypothetical protein